MRFSSECFSIHLSWRQNTMYFTVAPMRMSNIISNTCMVRRSSGDTILIFLVKENYAILWIPFPSNWTEVGLIYLASASKRNITMKYLLHVIVQTYVTLFGYVTGPGTSLSLAIPVSPWALFNSKRETFFNHSPCRQL